MSDLFSFDLADGFASGRCPICYAVDRHMRQWLEAFWREGRQNPAARERFYAGGGLCRRHVLMDGPEEKHPAAIADMYGQLARRDIAAIDELLARGSSRRRRLPVQLPRTRGCAACSEEADTVERQAAFFLELLTTAARRVRYEGGAAVCSTHLSVLLELADERLGQYLLADWRRRLGELQGRLEHFDRTRDHRYVGERTADDERACADVIRHYAGAEPEDAG